MDSQSLGREDNMARGIKSLSNYTVAEAQNAQLGQAGAIIIDGTDAISGPFVAVMGLEDSVVDTSECDVSWLSGTVPATFKIPAGKRSSDVTFSTNMWMRTERGKRTDMEFRNITMDEHIKEVEESRNATR
jgi:hypothetical protein